MEKHERLLNQLETIKKEAIEEIISIIKNKHNGILDCKHKILLDDYDQFIKVIDCEGYFENGYGPQLLSELSTDRIVYILSRL